MKKLALSLLICSGLAHASKIEATGEYRFGPDMPQNIACNLAEDQAKHNALTQSYGESISAVVYEQCTNESCKQQKDTLNDFSGYIRKVEKKTIQIEDGRGYMSCVVNLVADVQPTTNDIKLMVKNEFYKFQVNQEVQFRGVVNKPGRLIVYNYYDGIYQKIHQQTIAAKNTEFVIPSPTSSKTIIATLPNGVAQSKELVVFLFVDKDYQLKERYTQPEFINVLVSIPSENRKIENRMIYIMR